jgi:hypothetical protein
VGGIDLQKRLKSVEKPLKRSGGVWYEVRRPAQSSSDRSLERRGQCRSCGDGNFVGDRRKQWAMKNKWVGPA